MHSSQTVEKGAFPPLAPSARGLRPQAVGERTVRQSEIFRAMARLSPSAHSGHLPRRGRLFDTLRGMPNALLYFAFCGFYGGLRWGGRATRPPPHPPRTKKSAPRIERGPKLCYTTIMVCPARGRIGL